MSNLDYWYVENFVTGYAIFEKFPKSKGLINKKYDFKRSGLIDKRGDLIVPPSYHSVSNEFHGDYLLIISEIGKAGLLDKSGKILIPFEYEELHEISEDLIRALRNGKSGFINLRYEIVIPF